MKVHKQQCKTLVIFYGAIQLDDLHNEEIERESPLEKDLDVQSQSRKKLHWLRSLGPGLITGASDDDPSGIATYSQAGAQFGFGMLWMEQKMINNRTYLTDKINILQNMMRCGKQMGSEPLLSIYKSLCS